MSLTMLLLGSLVLGEPTLASKSVMECLDEPTLECVKALREALQQPLSSLLYVPEGSKDAPTVLAVALGCPQPTCPGDAYHADQPPQGWPKEAVPLMHEWQVAVESRANLVAGLVEFEKLFNQSQGGARALAHELRDDKFVPLRRSLRSINAVTAGHFGLVVRGGVSMGSYQAGFLYYLTSYLREYRTQLGHGEQPYAVVAGTSAGGMNAMAAVLESCRTTPSSPLESYFYEMWIEVGLAAPAPGKGVHVTTGLYDPSEVGEVNILSSKPIVEMREYMREEMESTDDWRKDCDVKLGLTATRTQPRLLSLGGTARSGGFQVPHQLERFAFSVRAKSVRDEPTHLEVTNFRPQEHAGRDGMLLDDIVREQEERYPQVVGDDPGELLDAALAIVQATGAVPFVFAPIEVPISYSDLVTDKYERVELLDGGVFDNRPFGFAARLRRWRYAERCSSKNAKADDPACDEEGRFVPRDPHEFIMLEPSITDFGPPRLDTETTTTNRAGALGLGITFVGSVLGTTRGMQLLDAADDFPYLRVMRKEVGGDYITKLPARRQVVTGEQLGKFLAFAERDFREFDFHVGMADARAYVAAHPIWKTTAIHANVVASVEARLGEAATERIAVIECSHRDECDSTDVPGHPNFGRLVRATRKFGSLPKSEQTIEAWFEQLAVQKFDYKDLERLDDELHTGPARSLGDRPDWHDVAALFRAAFGHITDAFVRTQPKLGERMLLRTGLDIGLDALLDNRFDRLTIDTAAQMTWGLSGFHYVVNLQVAGYLGSVGAVAGYLGTGLDYGIVKWFGFDDDPEAHVIGANVEPTIRGTFGDRRWGRALLQWETGVGMHIDLFSTFGDSRVALRWGPRVRFGVTIARHLQLSAFAKIRTDGCGRDLDWCIDQRNDEYRQRLQRAVDDDWQLGLLVGWRFRPITPKPRANQSNRSGPEH